MPRTTYEIHIEGHPPSRLVGELGATTQVDVPAETVLLTDAIDQEGLHALIARLESLGLELLELRRTAGRSSGP
ncbi:MAG: hypothetical protein ACRDV1_13280 [Actinomycetes bacterium]